MFENVDRIKTLLENFDQLWDRYENVDLGDHGYYFRRMYENVLIHPVLEMLASSWKERKRSKRHCVKILTEIVLSWEILTRLVRGTKKWA